MTKQNKMLGLPCGIQLETNKNIAQALQIVHGLGKTRALTICLELNLAPHLKVSQLIPEQLNVLDNYLKQYPLPLGAKLKKQTKEHLSYLKTISNLGRQKIRTTDHGSKKRKN